MQREQPPVAQYGGKLGLLAAGRLVNVTARNRLGEAKEEMV